MAGVNAATGQALSPAALAAGVAIATVTPSTGLATGERARTLAELKADSVNLLEFLPDAAAVADVRSRTSTTDYKTYIDAAIAAARSRRKPLYVPSGVYPTSGTHYLAQGTSSVFHAFILLGDGALGGAESGASNLGTAHSIFLALQVERPVFAIETARGVLVQGIGVGVAPSLSWPAYAGEPVDTQATYIATGAKTNRYAPFCAFAIDPTVGPAPSGGGYSAGALASPLTYQARAGAAGGSAHITFRDVIAEGFVVGWMHQPDGVTSQGDTVIWDDCRAKYCDTGIAFGNTQQRSCVVLGCEFANCRTALDGRVYGAQSGCPPQVFGGEAIACFRVFNLLNGFGHFNLTNFYAESTKMVGCFGSGVSNTKFPLNLTGCEFKLGLAGWAAPPWLLESWSPCEAKSTSFRLVNDNIDAVNFVGDQPMIVEGGTFAGLGTGSRPRIGTNLDLGQTKVTLARCSTVEASTIDLDDNPARLLTLPARVRATQRTRHVESSAGRYLYQPGTVNTYVNDAASGLSIDGTTGVLTATPGDASLYVLGDILFWLMKPLDTSLGRKVPAFKVTSATGAATVTASPLFDKSYYDTVVNNGNSISIVVEEWAPGAALTGDATSGSATLANVSPTTILKVGDWIARASSVFAVNSRVISVATPAAPVLNKTAASTKTGVPLFWGRLVPTDVIFGQKTYGSGAIAAGATVQTTAIATGTALGDFADASFSAALPTGVVMKSEATTSGVIVSFTNTTAGSLTPSGEIYVTSRHRPI